MFLFTTSDTWKGFLANKKKQNRCKIKIVLGFHITK